MCLCGLFEGAQYNSEAGAKCAVYSRARNKQGRGVIKEIRYIIHLAQLSYWHNLGRTMTRILYKGRGRESTWRQKVMRMYKTFFFHGGKADWGECI